MVAAFIVGLALARDGWQAAPALLAFIPLALLAQRSRWWLAAIVTAGLLLGVWRGGSYAFRHSIWENLYHQRLTLSGKVADDPVRNDKGHLRFTITDVQIEGLSIPGAVRVRSHYTWLERGFRINATGKIEPYSFGPQNAQIGFAAIEVTHRDLSAMEKLRRLFFAGMRNALPEPLASFALSLLTGARAALPPALQTDLATTGLTHIIAVSGYNLTIIVRSLGRVFGRVSRRLTTLASLWLIVGFVVLTGASPSIVRAGIVSVLLVLAAQYGRQIKPLSLIALAAGLTAFMNPNQVFQDLGWQLSFLAFFGILVISPILQQRWNLRGAVSGMALDSTAAHIATLPLIGQRFGQISLIAPVANLLVLPFIPFAMLLSFVGGLAGMTSPALAGPIAVPAQAVLALILRLINSLAVTEGSVAVQLSSAEAVLIIALVLAMTMAAYIVVRRRSSATDIMPIGKEESCPDIPSGQLLSIKKRLPMPGEDSRSPS